MNEITIVVRGDNQSKHAIKEPADDLDRLKTKAKAAGVDLDGLNAQFARVAGQADVFGGKLKGTGSFAQILDEKLGHLREETRRLGEEFNRTGKTDVLKKMFASQEAEQELKKLADRLASAIDQGAQEGGKDLNSAVQGFLSTPDVGPAIAVAITSAILAAAPLILASLDAVLLAAAGGGGLALGIIGQINDPAVHNAFDQLGGDLSDALTSATTSFRGPLVEAAKTLGTSLTGALGSIDFGTLAQSIEPLAQGIGGLVTNLMPGFNKALEAAGPILAGLGDDLPKLGAAIGQMFEHFSEGGKGAGEALHLLVIVVGSLAEAIGLFVLVGSKMLEWFFAAGEKIGDFISHINVGLPLIQEFGDAISAVFHFFAGDDNVVQAGKNLRAVGENAQLSASDIKALTDKLSEVGDATSALAAKWEAKLFGQMMNLDQATIHWHQSLNSLTDTLSQNGLAIDRHTHLISENSKAGLENRSAILAAVQANQAQYQAMVAGGISSIDAAKAYDQNTDSLRKQLLAAHYTAAQVDDLIGKYANVPDKVNTALAVGGLTDAINNLGNLIAEVNGIDGRKFGFYIVEHYQTDYSDYRRGERGNAHGGIIGAATGGIRSGLTMVGEHGRELVRLPVGSQVIPNGTTENTLAGVGASVGSGGGPAEVVTIQAGDSLMAGFIRQIQQYVRGAGGDGRTLGIVRVAG